MSRLHGGFFDRRFRPGGGLELAAQVELDLVVVVGIGGMAGLAAGDDGPGLVGLAPVDDPAHRGAVGDPLQAVALPAGAEGQHGFGRAGHFVGAAAHPRADDRGGVERVAQGQGVQLAVVPVFGLFAEAALDVDPGLAERPFGDLLLGLDRRGVEVVGEARRDLAAQEGEQGGAVANGLGEAVDALLVAEEVDQEVPLGQDVEGGRAVRGHLAVPGAEGLEGAAGVARVGAVLGQCLDHLAGVERDVVDLDLGEAFVGPVLLLREALADAVGAAGAHEIGRQRQGVSRRPDVVVGGDDQILGRPQQRRVGRPRPQPVPAVGRVPAGRRQAAVALAAVGDAADHGVEQAAVVEGGDQVLRRADEALDRLERLFRAFRLGQAVERGDRVGRQVARPLEAAGRQAAARVGLEERTDVGRARGAACGARRP